MHVSTIIKLTGACLLSAGPPPLETDVTRPAATDFGTAEVAPEAAATGTTEVAPRARQMS